MKNIAIFFVLVFWFMGLVGGVGYSLYGGSYPIAIGCLTNGMLAFPYIKKLYNDMMS